MDDSDDRPGSDSGTVIERGDTYSHSEYGEVEVTGIWNGVEEVDEAKQTEEKDVYIVRFSGELEGEEVDELADTVDEFIRSVE